MNTDAPWPDLTEAEARVLGIQTKLHQWALAQRHGLVESRMRGNTHVRFGGAGWGNGRFERNTPRPGPTPTSRSPRRLTSTKVRGGQRPRGSVLRSVCLPRPRAAREPSISRDPEAAPMDTEAPFGALPHGATARRSGADDLCSRSGAFRVFAGCARSADMARSVESILAGESLPRCLLADAENFTDLGP